MHPRPKKTGTHKRSTRKRRGARQLLNPDAAGIDVGSRFHAVAVPPDRDTQTVQLFGNVTAELRRLADWLVACGVKTVAMESTGVYWVPLYEILEERGVEVALVNARHVKHVPGRKSDIQDCQWLQELHTYGLLQGSFRPPADVVQLRSYLRQRERLIQYAAAHVQHMQKALTLMNVQLHTIITDISGTTGMAIMRAICQGNTSPEALAAFRDVRCKASVEQFVAALTGTYRPEHIFALQQAIELYETYQAKIQDCDTEIEMALGALKDIEAATERTLPPNKRGKRRCGRNEPSFDIRKALFAKTGVDLTQIDAIGPYSALCLISETGTDMGRFPTAKNFTSWLGLSPSNKISGGKLLGSQSKRTASRAAHLFRLAAMNVGRMQTALGAFYRRLSARVGKGKAIVATARKLAVIYYSMLKHGTAYNDPGADAYERRYRHRTLVNLHRRARVFGYQLTPVEPVPTQAAVS